MERIDYYIRISQLIAKEVNYELTTEEKYELVAWLNQSKENLKLYNKIRSREKFLNWDQEFHHIDSNKGWDRFEEAVSSSRKPNVFKTIIRYAAVLLLPLFLSGLGFYLYQNVSHFPEQEVQVLSPQVKKGARLTLADGSKVFLANPKDISLKERDGTLIKKDAAGLKYQNKAKEGGRLTFNTVEIPKGENYQLLLADGTKVHLNSMSTFRFPTHFKGDRREVELSGEAYFEVEKDSLRPFLVNVNGMKVKVLGTSFNVKAYAEEANVVTTLVEGSVKLKSSQVEKSTLLKPGQQAVMDDNSGEFSVQEVDVNLFVSWKDGVFLFKSQRLEDVMNELSRWYDLKVFYMNPSVKDLRFGGSFNRNEDVKSLMEMFQLTRKVNIEVNGKTILISAK